MSRRALGAQRQLRLQRVRRSRVLPRMPADLRAPTRLLRRRNGHAGLRRRLSRRLRLSVTHVDFDTEPLARGEPYSMRRLDVLEVGMKTQVAALLIAGITIAG